MGLFWSFGNY